MNSPVNTRRADLDLPQFDLPPAEPVFSPNPVAELAITNNGGQISLKVRVPSAPAQCSRFPPTKHRAGTIRGRGVRPQRDAG